MMRSNSTGQSSADTTTDIGKKEDKETSSTMLPYLIFEPRPSPSENILINYIYAKQDWQIIFPAVVRCMNTPFMGETKIRRILDGLTCYLDLKDNAIEQKQTRAMVIALLATFRQVGNQPEISSCIISSSLPFTLAYYLKTAYRRKDSELMWALLNTLYVVHIKAKSRGEPLVNFAEYFLAIAAQFCNQIVLSAERFKWIIWSLKIPFLNFSHYSKACDRKKMLMEALNGTDDNTFTSLLVQSGWENDFQLRNSGNKMPINMERLFRLLNSAEKQVRKRAIKSIEMIYRQFYKPDIPTFTLTNMHDIICAVEEINDKYYRTACISIISRLHFRHKILCKESKMFFLRKIPYFLTCNDGNQELIEKVTYDLLLGLEKDERFGIIAKGLFDAIYGNYSEANKLNKLAWAIMWGQDEYCVKND